MLRTGRRVGRMMGLCLCLCAATAAGCGGGGGPQASGTVEEQADLRALEDLGENYRQYSIAKNQPPQKIEDLSAIEAMNGVGVAAVRDGNIVVQWGATLLDLGEEPGKVSSPEVLAYVKAVPEQGGPVLMLDRTIKKMSAEEFKAAPKAAAKK
jgi:hypothetical protein